MERNRIALLVGAGALMLGLAAAGQASTEWRATMSGIGPIRVGMSAAALEHALGTRLPETQDQDEDACRSVEAGTDWPGTSVMLVHGRVERIDVSTRGIFTLSGAAVGDTQASVLKRYGRRLSVSTSAEGVDDSKYLTMLSSDHRLGIRFETDGERVTGYYVGNAGAVMDADGCL
jgi:hypothetical protein